MRLLIVGAVGLLLALFASPPALTSAAGPAGVVVSVGYFDNEHGANTPPNDWSVTGASSASINFVGGPMSPPGPQGGTWDSGGIRFDNSTAAPIALDSVVVTIGAQRYNAANQLWAPARLIIPAHGSMILASPTATRGLFDTSDYHCNGNPPKGPRDGIIPQIAVTQAGTATNFVDTTQVLTYDCTKPETHNWVPISTGGAPPPPPSAPSIATPADGSFNNTGNVTLTGSAQANSTVTVFDGSTSLGTTPANGSGNWTKGLTSVPDGIHSYTATATDAANHTSGPSSATHVTVDTHAPDTSITSGPAGTITQTSASFTFVSSKTASKFQCKLAGPGSRPGAFSACSSPARFARLARGSYTFTVRATDAAGITDPNPPSRRFSVAARSTRGQAVTSIALRPASFRAASRSPSLTSTGGNTGTTVAFTLTGPDTVRFTLERRLVGRKVHGRCVAASSHNRHRTACTRYRHVSGSFARIGIAGSNGFHFTGLMGGRALVPGRYRLVATPTTGRGDETTFRIVA